MVFFRPDNGTGICQRLNRGRAHVAPHGRWTSLLKTLKAVYMGLLDAIRSSLDLERILKYREYDVVSVSVSAEQAHMVALTLNCFLTTHSNER